jgi:tRNA pseudouridine38-40 synthase
VQGTFEKTFTELLRCDTELRTVASGRTDRGVHASAQVLHTDVALQDLAAFARSRRLGDVAPDAAPVLERLAGALDRALPPSIVVRRVLRVPDDFSARFSARWRAYRYRLRDDVDPRAVPRDPETGRTPRGVARDAPGRVGDHVHRLDVPVMRRRRTALLGEHDFAAFCRRAEGRTTVRRIDLLTLLGWAGTGPDRRRLRGQRSATSRSARSSAASSTSDGGSAPVEWIADILAAKDRSLAAAVAPPHGLTLERVHFGSGTPASPPPGTIPRARLARRPTGG